MFDGIFFGLAIVLLAGSVVVRRRAAPLSSEHQMATAQMYLWSGMALSKVPVLAGLAGGARVVAFVGTLVLLGAAVVTLRRLRREQKRRASGPAGGESRDGRHS